MGVSRTIDGDYLSSADVELLLALAGYVGIAIENAGLYRSLQRKVEENERLKEFNENIVESINVGILAADLEDRVESWNTQLEQLSGIPRHQAVGKRLSESVPRRPGSAIRTGSRRNGHPPYLQVRLEAASLPGTPSPMATAMATAIARRRGPAKLRSIWPLRRWFRKTRSRLAA